MEEITMEELEFTVLHINAGPAPFDVTATTEGVECRLRFDSEHPAIVVGDTVTVSYTPAEPVAPAED